MNNYGQIFNFAKASTENINKIKSYKIESKIKKIIEKLLVLIIFRQITVNVTDSHTAINLIHDLLMEQFLEKAKIANTRQSTRKKQGSELKNYRPVSILYYSF